MLRERYNITILPFLVKSQVSNIHECLVTPGEEAGVELFQERTGLHRPSVTTQKETA